MHDCGAVDLIFDERSHFYPPAKNKWRIPLKTPLRETEALDTACPICLTTKLAKCTGYLKNKLLTPSIDGCSRQVFLK